jgi:D-glycerate 3-kinase
LEAVSARPAGDVDETSLSDFLERERLPPAFQQWIDDLYRPLAGAILARRGDTGVAIVVGLCGPQGSGKSTGARVLAHLLNSRGVRTAVLSLDDLYLTRAERAALASEVHPLLMTRGPPGTHDTALGARLLRDLAHRASTRTPSFDKASDDRAPPSRWPEVAGPSQIILFEGWCVGARPQADDALGAPINALEQSRDPGGVWRGYVNERLGGPYQDLFRPIDLQIMFRPPDFDIVLKWRLEQEHKLRDRAVAQGNPPASILTDEQVAGFIQHYERISRHMDAEMPSRADIVITLDDERRPIAVKTR